MRTLTLLALLVAVALAAFSLAISGLGAVGNFLVFAAASVGLLVVTVNLTSPRRSAAVAPAEEPRQKPTA